MSFANRTITSNLHRPSTIASQSSNGQSPALLSRVNEKKIELENLKQLRDLSAGLASQMQDLQDKLATLADGTEAVAVVLSNWHNVLRAINMASMKLANSSRGHGLEALGEEMPSTPPLPQTLVRIPLAEEPHVVRGRSAEDQGQSSE